MTYSIVGRDVTAGHVGGAVQSAAFSAGPRTVVWAEAGVGAVATQAYTERSYGPLGLEMLRTGRTPDQVLPSLVAFDDLREHRQLGIIDLADEPAAFTGGDCVPEASHAFGVDCAAQANMMARPGVPQAMVDAFETSTGDLTQRLLSALDAAQAVGGDFRGMQSAGIMVRHGELGSPEWTTRLVDIRVEDHARPLDELRRLVDLTRIYRRWREPMQLLRDGLVSDAAAAAREVAAKLPHKVEPRIHLAIALVAAGERTESRELVREAMAIDPRWLLYIDRVLGIWDVGIEPAAIRQLLE